MRRRSALRWRVRWRNRKERREQQERGKWGDFFAGGRRGCCAAEIEKSGVNRLDNFQRGPGIGPPAARVPGTSLARSRYERRVAGPDSTVSDVAVASGDRDGGAEPRA